MNKPLLQITRVDLKGVERALSRIADTLDLFLLYAHNHTTDAVLKRRLPPETGEEPTLDYSTDLATAVQEVRDQLEAVEKGED